MKKFGDVDYDYDCPYQLANIDLNNNLEETLKLFLKQTWVKPRMSEHNSTYP